MVKLKKNAGYLLGAFLLSGCAYYSNLTPVKIDASLLELPVVRPGPDRYSSQQIVGSSEVGFRPYVSPAAVIAGAFAASIASGNVNTGISLSSNLKDNRNGENSPFGPGVLVDVPKIYFSEVLHEKGIFGEKTSKGLPQQMEIYPKVNLVFNEKNQIELWCSLTADTSGWRFHYSYQRAFKWEQAEVKEIKKERFQEEIVSCLNVLNTTMRAHIVGNLDNSFKRGVLMYKESFGYKGMFAEDDINQVYLRYVDVSNEIVVFPKKYAYDFKYN